MNGLSNTQIRLAARPMGMPKPSDWETTVENVTAPRSGDVLVKTLYLSLDPAMRGWMNEGRSYIPPVKIGAVMRAGGVGVVVASEAPGFAPGDYVYGTLNIQEYALLAAGGLTKIDVSVAPLPVYLNVLGMPGMTAYFGLIDVGRPVAGNTVVVSGAAGAVGMTVGQVAKILGCRVVGIAGGAEKCRFVTDELGFDAAIDYKADDLGRALREQCPDGIDVYFDNVGGATLNAALARLAMHARVVICGAISQYNATSAIEGPSNYLSLLVNRASMQGMVVFDYAPRYAQAVRAMSGWVAEGKLKSREDIVPGGVAAFPETLLKLFRGENLGKLVLHVADA
jgi:NADPH-dependent curcumin reductase CurA